MTSPRAQKVELSFLQLALQLTLISSAMVVIMCLATFACGYGLHLGESVLAAMAATMPLLMSARVTAEIAKRYDLIVASAFFMGYRLAITRALVGVAMILVAVHTIEGTKAESAIIRFALMYSVLVVLAARWIALGKTVSGNTRRMNLN